mmetsp:Transcript_20777/g.30755  ORF Transcript_20777/g.30755 Transcript_20777/m.30755 type:complete len:624 (+) Transcript_20777:99-1970(+)|eukprot:CAMPEP_0194229980 /NCGR_PEP_ID=MMETSP0156-20130528/44170_1 /TAXON_ID=33649 /ORGANISM="Thalassionema nitzschioides, Strain L26-B" /LENGTH=623 /DNA_ID=CAMNT_0038962549 /DNA_START=32 /DNA_END=1903 /DNA_ORIENTATION=+
MSRRYKDSSSKARSSFEEDNFVEFLRSENRSEAESTALSSLLPVLQTSKVRATAPRASLPEMNDDLGLSAMSTREDTTSSKSDAKHRKSDGSQVKDLDDYTVETNRPIDSVYIYPTAPPAKHHRQRRNYRSGQRSNEGSRVGSLDDRSSRISISNNNNFGGLLETLGLGNASEDEGHDHSTRNSNSKYGKSLASSRDTWDKRQRRRGGDTGPQVHFRAALVLCFLMSILYGAFQWISMAKENKDLMLKNSGKFAKMNIRSHHGAFEEGLDRPVDGNILSKMASPAKATKVEKKDESKEDLLDNEKVLGFDEEEQKQQEEKAPADSLAAIDEEEEKLKAVLSLDVQSGLSGVYSKDPSHHDLPFLWYIPRSGGGMIKNILSNCKDLVVASEVGASVAKKDQLSVIEVAGHKYVNVDTTTEAGIEDAKAKGLAASGLAELVVSPRLQEAAGLFGPSKQGRAFTLIRHPVERAVSMFFFLKKHKVPAVASLELEDYCRSQHVENNWMVRILSGSMTGEVGDDHLEIAKKVLREKVIIGLLEQKEESLRRFEHHFGWRYTENNQKQTSCRTRILVGDYRSNESAKHKIKEGSQAWSLLMWQNRLDMKLYKYAKALYLQQGTELFHDM